MGQKIRIKLLFPLFAAIISLLAAACSEEQPHSVERLEASVRSISSVPACEQIYRDIVYIGEEQNLLFFKTVDKQLLFSIDIIVQAGIENTDLIEIEYNGNSDNGRPSVVINLPDPVILDVDADESSIKQFFIKEYGKDITRLEYYDEINRKKEEIVEDAVKNGIIERADANIRNLISNMMSLAGIEVASFRRIEE